CRFHITHADGIVLPGPGGWMTWATPLCGEVVQVKSPGPLHNRWCCDPELKPPSDNSRRL
ncbi:hypothetical protein XpopCFBP1817_20545, partial [Xanthomonas populi]